MNTFEGKLVSKGVKIGIVAARFNEFIKTPQADKPYLDCSSRDAYFSRLSLLKSGLQYN